MMKKSLVNSYLMLILLFSALVIMIVSALYIKIQDDIFVRTTQELQSKLIENYKSELKNRVDIIEQSISYKKSTAEQRLRKNIAQHVNEAVAIAENIYLLNQNSMSDEQIKKMIIEALRPMRFNDGRGYFFIDTLEGDCVLFPTRPVDEGKNILHYQDVNGKFVIKDFVDIAKAHHEGYSEYYTNKPSKKDIRSKKIAYVKRFERFNWIIGTGEYEDDVNEDIKKEIATEVSHFKTRIGESYITIFEIHNLQGGENSGTLIVNPLENNNSIYGVKVGTEVHDIDGVFYRQEALNQINQKGEAFVTYKGEKMNSHELVSKITYSKLIEHWNWLVCSAKQLDEFELAIQENKAKIREQISENIRYAFILFFILFVALLILSFGLSKKLKRDLTRINTFFRKASRDKIEIDTAEFKIEEFKELAYHANAMIKEINFHHENLESINEHLEQKVYEKTKELQVLNFSLEVKNRELKHNFVTDALTKLPNRNMFLSDVIYLSFPQVILVDIDGFKHINDFYGTDVGDMVLIEFAEFIRKFAQPLDMKVYRLSSDEFLLLNDKAFDKEFLQSTVHTINSSLNRKKFKTHDKELQFQINVTCGVAFGKSNLLEKADIALNFAKKKKLSYAIYNEENSQMNTHKQNMYWRQKIKDAIENDRITPYFQKIINVKDERINKYECLMRLLDDDKAYSPFLFLDVAKETKLYHELTRIMIEKCFQTFANHDASFALNFSLLDIENKKTVSFLEEHIVKYNVGSRLILELLESEEILQSNQFLPFVEKMKALGVRFALDDFGSGYSNFAFVLKIAPAFLKIDGSLIKNMIADKNSYTIVQAIIAFAREINAEVIAEFVENEELMQALQSCDVHLMQGYFFSIPSATLNP